MRLSLILPPAQPEVYPAVTACPVAGCGGRHLQHWQAVPKPLRDTHVDQVVAHRYRCLGYGRTLPTGQSARAAARAIRRSRRRFFWRRRGRGW